MQRAQRRIDLIGDEAADVGIRLEGESLQRGNLGWRWLGTRLDESLPRGLSLSDPNAEAHLYCE